MAYHLAIPPRWRVHDVFHVSLLKSYKEGGGDGLAVPEPILVDGQEEWEVERILKQRGKGRRVQFLVKYTGFNESESRWLARKDLANCPEVLAEWE